MILETIHNFLHWTADFAFNWTTFFWSIPIWFILILLLIKKTSKQVLLNDLPPALFISLFNPLFYCAIALAIILSPIIILVALYAEFWDDIKDKKIF